MLLKLIIQNNKRSFWYIPAFLLLVWISLFVGSCTQQADLPIIVSRKDFKVTFPYEVDRVGIFINTRWGTSKTIQRLYLDNHSPTWANDSFISGNGAIRKSKSYEYRTKTAEGFELNGDVYICDSISIAEIVFKNVPYYRIANPQNKVNGVIGENIISRGIWKIDFKNNIITFASHIDSIEDIKSSNLLKSRFTDQGIEIDAVFRNNVAQTIQLDLGYNLSLIMPSKEFKEISKGNDKRYTELLNFSTLSGSQEVETTQVFDSVLIDRNYFTCIISSNSLVKEALMGRLFLQQFEFMILDYLNRSVYVSKSRLY